MKVQSKHLLKLQSCKKDEQKRYNWLSATQKGERPVMLAEVVKKVKDKVHNITITKAT